MYLSSNFSHPIQIISEVSPELFLTAGDSCGKLNRGSRDSDHGICTASVHKCQDGRDDFIDLGASYVV